MSRRLSLNSAAGKPHARYVFSVLILALLVSLGACVAPTRGDLLKKFRENPELGAYIRNVPFYPQEEFMCGPSVLTSILNYYSSGYDIDAVQREVFTEELNGTLMMDMLIYAKLKGFKTEAYLSDMIDLKIKLRQKKPLILFLNLGSEKKPRGHYIVAIGYDDDTKIVIAHSGVTEAEMITYEALKSAWEKTDYSALLITP
ncbi:MAG: cysteine peptidase family C39 domain-containing protein [Thermodesulfobacteriota bacterium]